MMPNLQQVEKEDIRWKIGDKCVRYRTTTVRYRTVGYSDRRLLTGLTIADLMV